MTTHRGIRLPLVSLLFLALASTVTALDDLPEPAAGDWGATTVALLHYHGDLCSRLTDQLMGVWRGEDPAHAGVAHDYMLKDGSLDLAAARAAEDVIDDFIPRAAEEVHDETVASMQRLLASDTELCDLAAHPQAPFTDFEARVLEARQRGETERIELSRLMVIPDPELARYLEPYLTPIQMAGVEAQADVKAYLDSLKPPPRPPTQTELMAYWNEHTYAPAVRPVKSALGDFLSARRAGDSRSMATACRELSAETIRLLDQRAVVFTAPDTEVNPNLERAFLQLRLAASSCTQGKFDQVDRYMASMQQHLTRAARQLQAYGLRP
ncbi:MAG: hypothetical protein AAGD38_20810 [Acidobacteriota bacterium]